MSPDEDLDAEPQWAEEDDEATSHAAKLRLQKGDKEAEKHFLGDPEGHA